MKLRQPPYAQIAQVLLRSINPQDARWLFLMVACFLGFAVVSTGISTDWQLGAVIKAVIGVAAFCLQFTGVGAFTVLMRLNHPVPSQTVPGYVSVLRRSTLGIWLAVGLLTGLAGLLDNGLSTNLLWLVFWAGASMLLISTPLRWPFRWFLCLVGLVWFLRVGVTYLLSFEPKHQTFWAVVNLVAVLIYAGMAWLVTRMIADKGSPYAAVFSKFLAAQHAERISDKPETLVFNKFSLWHQAYVRTAQWAKLPWQHYASYIVSAPQPGPANALARAELGFGAVVHWVSQVSLSAVFALVLVLVWWANPGFLLSNGASMSPITTFYLAMASAACAATSVLYISVVMLRTQGEQKLMLLLPAVPQGNALSRMLAARHLRQAFVAWALATAWALVLPYPDSVAQYVAAFCWGTLPLVPMVVQDWAHLRPPEAVRALGRLVLAMLVPVGAWAALRWLYLPVELLAAVSVGLCLLVLRVRWRRVAHYAQALPVGRLA
jgi:hypothetical protein